MARTTETRPEPKSIAEMIAELSAHLTDIDAQFEALKVERFRTEAALLALQGRKRAGRPRTTV